MDCSTPGFPVHHQLRSLLKLMSIKTVMPSNHLILCHPLLLLPLVLPRIRVFSNESVLHIRRPKYWSFSFSISPSNEYSPVLLVQVSSNSAKTHPNRWCPPLASADLLSAAPSPQAQVPPTLATVLMHQLVNDLLFLLPLPTELQFCQMWFLVNKKARRMNGFIMKCD